MQIDFDKLIIPTLTAWYFFQKWYDAIAKVLEPVIIEIEKLAHDGLIDKGDRKAIAQKAVEILQDKGYLKLNPISRLIINKVINRIAAKLPDYTVSKEVKDIVGKAKDETAIPVI